MIVPMKKVVIIVQSKDADSTVQKLRSLGLLHVEHQKATKSKDITILKDNIELINKAASVLSMDEFTDSSIKDEAKETRDWEFIAKHVIDCWKRFSQLREFSRKLESNISQWQEWGDFDPEMIHSLSKKNIYIRLYQVLVKEIKNFPSGIIVKVVSKAKGLAKCVVVSQEKVEIPFKEINLPKMGLEKMRLRLAEDNRFLESIKSEIKRYTYYLNSLILAKKSLEKDLEFQEALNGMGQFESLEYLKGYVPFDAMELLLETAKRERWGVTISDPCDDDNVPTLIRNPRWISLINPLFKLLEIVPGYRELDISLFFLVFFSLFFGILIGDAGYGAIYLVLTFWAQKKFGKKVKDKNYFFLFYVLSLCAITWGLLTGTIFGQEWLAKTGFKPLVPALNEVKNIQRFCFFVGALHLTFAHSWRALLKLPSLTALSDIGWIFVLWAAFFFAKLLILADVLPVYAIWFLIIGITFVVLFTNPQKNILKTIGDGMGTLALSLMNNFTDVVSYVRLFAVGLAGVAIADTFNAMAAGVGTGNIVAALVGVFIILTGHALNLVLGPMSVLVHGVRLNVLEFSGHASVTWSGFTYKPLRE